MKQKKSSPGSQQEGIATVPMEQNICEFLAQRPRRYRTIMAHLGLPAGSRKELRPLLADLEARGKLRHYRGDRWGLANAADTFEGFITFLPSGAARVPIPFAGGGELHIAATDSAGAWQGDLVLVEQSPDKTRGRVLRVLQRAQTEQLGLCVGKCRRGQIFRPVAGGQDHFFLVSLACGEKFARDELVLLKVGGKLREQHEARSLWQATPIKSFGPRLSVPAQEAIVKHCRHVPGAFPELALAQAQSLPAEPAANDLEMREDLRHVPFVTIDGANARDFDDAIHVQKTKTGFLLRVAIADVSHYVAPDARPGSLDQEARRRGNSWYFPASVEPMLPQVLSNGLCSLRPGEDKLAMLAEMPFTSAGLPLQPRFASIVMRSAARLTYDQVADFFADSKETLPENSAAMLRDARELYELLARKRQERGTIDFTIPEPGYKLDANGELLAIADAERNDAHRLIEEFMIAANEAVATFLGQRAQPFLYRVHPAPEPDRLTGLFETLRLTALETLPPHLQKDGSDARAILTILARAQGTPQQYLVNRLCLRAMGQARYQGENIGHFGLASAAYCHFTSPIRRYADLTVHRTLKAALGQSASPLPDREALDSIANGLNEQERKAVECERDIARRLTCLLLARHVGETREGIVSGVTDFGLFVEFLDMPADGLLRIADLGQEWFELDQQCQCLVGRSTGKLWQLGQKLTVRISAVDLDKLEVTLQPAGASAVSQRKRSSHRQGHPKDFKAGKKGPWRKWHNH